MTEKTVIGNLSLQKLDAIKRIANNLDISDSWLLAVMHFESRLNPMARNPISRATGLIQFMPATLAQWGLTVDHVAAMSFERQLDLVEKYLKPYKSKFQSLTDVYLAVFYPAAIGKPLDFKFPHKVWEQNKVFDTKKRGYLLKSDIVDVISSRYQWANVEKKNDLIYLLPLILLV